MSLFRSSDNAAAGAPTPGNARAQNVASNEQARPVPYLAGTQPVALAWLSPEYNAYTTPIITHGPKDQSIKTGDNFFCDVAGLACIGLASRLLLIEINGERCWPEDEDDGGLARIEGEDYADITTPRALVRVYWGTETQPVDDLVLGAKGHPAYRGQCYFVFRKLHKGQHTPTLPTIRVVLECAPQVPWLGDGLIEGDANPAHVAIEFTSNPRAGLGLRQSVWSAVLMEELAALARTNGFGVSPLINTAAGLDQWLSELAGYFDGWLDWSSGRMTLRSAIVEQDDEGAPVLELDQLAETPRTKAPAYADAATETRVIFSNRAREWQPMPAPHYEPGAQSLLGWRAPVELQRTWITRESLANQVAARAGRRAALPPLSSEIMVLAGAAAALRPGALFFLRPWRGAAILLRCLCKRVVSQGPLSREAKLVYDQDVAAAGETDYTPPDYTPPAADPVEPESPVAARLLELPRPLAPLTTAGLPIAIIAARSHSMINGATFWRSNAGATYGKVGNVPIFAATGTLDADIGPDATTLVLNMHPVDRLTISSQEAVETADDAVLVIIGDEVMSLADYTLLAGDQAELANLVRARFDTLPLPHAAGARVFIIAKAAAAAFLHSTFKLGDTRWFKLTMRTPGREQGLDDADEMEHTFSSRRTRPLAHAGFTANGDGVAPTYATGGNVALAWTIRTWTDAGYPDVDFYGAGSIQTSIELLDNAGAHVAWLGPTGAAATTFNVTNSHITTAFSGEPAEFQVKVWARIGAGIMAQFAPALVVTLAP